MKLKFTINAETLFFGKQTQVEIKVEAVISQKYEHYEYQEPMCELVSARQLVNNVWTDVKDELTPDSVNDLISVVLFDLNEIKYHTHGESDYDY